jgi:hypothetical protein
MFSTTFVLRSIRRQTIPKGWAAGIARSKQCDSAVLDPQRGITSRDKHRNKTFLRS